MVHGYQFEKGDLDFESNNSGNSGLLRDITDELAAFTRQYAFTGSNQMYNLNQNDIRKMTNRQNQKINSTLPSVSLNKNSDLATLYFNNSYNFNLKTQSGKIYHETKFENGNIFK